MEEIKVVGLVWPIKILNTFEWLEKTRMDFCFDHDLNNVMLEWLHWQTAYAISVWWSTIAWHYLHDIQRLFNVEVRRFNKPITREEAEKCEEEYYRYITENWYYSKDILNPFDFEYYHLLPKFFEWYFNSIGMVVK